MSWRQCRTRHSRHGRCVLDRHHTTKHSWDARVSEILECQAASVRRAGWGLAIAGVGAVVPVVAVLIRGVG